MVKGYFQERTRIWLNATLGAYSDQAAESAVDTEYKAYPAFDCNFNDIGKHSANCKGLDRDACVSALEPLCDQDPKCIGFNYPGCIFKSACPACTTRPPCNGWEPSPSSTFYFKPGHQPPEPVTSSCIDGFCFVQPHGNGTYHSADCNKQCPFKPPPPNIAKLLAAFDDEWSHRSWDKTQNPAQPVGDPVQMAKMMLKKYP